MPVKKNAFVHKFVDSRKGRVAYTTVLRERAVHKLVHLSNSLKSTNVSWAFVQLLFRWSTKWTHNKIDDSSGYADSY